jgi:hypothetical protein
MSGLVKDIDGGMLEGVSINQVTPVHTHLTIVTGDVGLGSMHP